MRSPVVLRSSMSRAYPVSPSLICRTDTSFHVSISDSVCACMSVRLRVSVCV